MNGNFKIRALKSDDDYFIKGDVIEFKNGHTRWRDGEDSCEYESYKEFIKDNYLWEDFLELIEEKEEENKIEDLRELIKPCYVVKFRDEEWGIAMIRINEIIGFHKINDISSGITNLSYMDKNLEDINGETEYDIVEIRGYSDVDQKDIESRPLIWKREEKSPTQLEIESIELEQRKLADRLSELRKEL